MNLLYSPSFSASLHLVSYVAESTLSQGQVIILSIPKFVIKYQGCRKNIRKMLFRSSLSIKIRTQNTINRGAVLKREAIFLIALLFSLTLSIPNVKATQISLVAVADSYVDSLSPEANNGDSIFLYTHNYNNSYKNVWVKFDLSEIPSQATVNSIILRMHTSITGTRTLNEVGVFVCDVDSWAEFGITWNNAPSPSSTFPLQIVDVADTETDYDFNLTAVLTGRSVVSLVLKTIQSSKEPAFFDSKEGSNGPRLIVDYVMPSPPLDTVFMAIVGIGIVVLVVLGVFIFRLRQKKEKGK